MNQFSIPLSHEVHQLADKYLLWDLSVIPIRHGTKLPSLNWKPFTSNPATQAQIDRWFYRRRTGLGVICGDASNGLVCLDFNVPGSYEVFLAQNPGAANLPTARTARGKHVFFRSPTPVDSMQIYIDGVAGKCGNLLGNGSFVTLPPTVHPAGNIRSWIVPICKGIPVINLDDFKLGIFPLPPVPSTEDIFTKEVFEEGCRHRSLAEMTREFSRLELSVHEIEEAIHQTNRLRCLPPLSKKAVDRLIQSHLIDFGQPRELDHHLTN